MAEVSESRNEGALPADWLAMICLQAAQSDRSDAAVRQVFELLQTIADSLPLNLLIKDHDGRRVFCNKGYLQLFSVQRDDVLNKTDFDLFPDEQARLFSGEDAQVLRTGKEVRAAQEAPGTEGNSIWIERVKRPLHDNSGSIVGVQVLFSDATEREQKVQERELERDLFYSLMDNIPDAIYFKNEESQFLHVSAALARKHRLDSIDELIGKTDADVFTGEHAQQARDDELEIMRTGHPLVARLERETWPDREDSWVSSTKMPLRNRRGEIVGTFGISRDVTELKRMQDQLQIARDAADAASKAKSDFLANMSHEIRTPMNGILGMTDLLLNTDLTEEQREYQLLVQSSADSLLALLNDILDFSKVEAGKIELEHLPFQLRDTLGNTLRTLANRAAEKGIELAAHILSDVPDDLLGDASRLRQIVVNLVGNAIKFTHEGEIVVKVTPLQITADCANLRFAVSDTGIGISAEQKARIFDSFTQADASTTREFGGTGLGLAISSKLVNVMGSQLLVDSQLGEGSTFHFAVEIERAPTRPTEETTELSTLHRLPVLVVDDNGTNRVICEEMLENWGMKPTTAASGQRGLELFDQAIERGDPFRLVLVDVMMPEMDGFDFVQHLQERTDGLATKIIILSSANRPEDGARSRNLGVSCCMTKPVAQSELLNSITSVMGIARADEAPSELFGGNGSANRVPLKILLAEDGAVNRKVAVSLLEKRGHHVMAVENGLQAVNVFQQQQFDAILMDVQMPELDGLEATATIRQIEVGSGNRIPIIAITAHAMKGDRQRCLDAGMDAYLSKPFKPRDLFASIESIAGQKKNPIDDRPAPDLSGSASLFTTAPATTNSTPPTDVRPASDLSGSASLFSPSPPPADSAAPQRTSTNSTQPFDYDSALENVGGSEAVLLEMIELFRVECPKQLAGVETALASGNHEAVMRAAHTFKGSLALFAADAATAAAKRIESMGRHGKLDDHPAAWKALNVQVDELLAGLRVLKP